MEYRDFINTNMNDVITALNGSITPAPVNSELYRDFLNRKADDVITALNGSITPAPAGDELYRDFIERKFDDVITGIGGYVPPVTFPTVSGSICSFNSAVAGLPLKSHTVALTATQSGSGTPSPDNVRTINGYSAINISQSGADTSTPTVYVINLGGTYYGGEYDARTGVLTVTHGYIEFDGTENWINVGGSYPQAFQIDTGITNAFQGAIPTQKANNITNLYPWSSSEVEQYGIRWQVGVQSGRLFVYDNNYSSDLAGFKQHLSDTHLQVVYWLNTPITIQLPPCPIDTLEGVNNIFADAGDTTLQYIKIGGNT